MHNICEHFFKKSLPYSAYFEKMPTNHSLIHKIFIQILQNSRLLEKKPSRFVEKKLQATWIEELVTNYTYYHKSYWRWRETWTSYDLLYQVGPPSNLVFLATPSPKPPYTDFKVYQIVAFLKEAQLPSLEMQPYLEQYDPTNIPEEARPPPPPPIVDGAEPILSDESSSPTARRAAEAAGGRLLHN